MHVNYLYVLKKCETLTGRRAKILDYGCGAGDIVEAGCNQGLELFGVEAFYEGGSTRTQISEKGLLDTRVWALEDDRIPFPEGYFDLVVSNQVFEHVADMKLALEEIHRVLKPDGRFLCLFPSKDTMREGHCGVPLAHWFPKGSTHRYYWMMMFRKLGFGYHTGGKSAERWSRDFMEWLDNFTFYRSYSEIRDTFKEYFGSFARLEDDYVAFRLGQRSERYARFARLGPMKYLCRWLFKKFGGLVILAGKPRPRVES